mgnify:CR=1 FL=1
MAKANEQFNNPTNLTGNSQPMDSYENNVLVCPNYIEPNEVFKEPLSIIHKDLNMKKINAYKKAEKKENKD